MPGHVRTAKTNGVNTVGGSSSLFCNYHEGRCKRKQRQSTMARECVDSCVYATLRISCRRATLVSNVTVIFFVPHNERCWLATWPGAFTLRLRRNRAYNTRKKCFLIPFLFILRPITGLSNCNKIRLEFVWRHIFCPRLNNFIENLPF